MGWYSALTRCHRPLRFLVGGEDRAHGLLERATLRQAVRPRNGVRRLFSVASFRRFTSRNKIAGSRHPPLRYGRCRYARRCRSGPPAAFRRHEGRDERSRSDKRKFPMTTDHDETSYEPPHATSPTDHILAELQLHGYRP